MLGNNLLFKTSIMQPIRQTIYNLNRKELVHYSSHDQSSKTLDDQTDFDHSNNELVHYSDPHCIFINETQT